MMAEDTVSGSTTESDFDPRKYQPRYAVDAVKLRLFNATREEMSRWFGVQEMFLDIWAEQHEEFAKALQVAPNAKLKVTDDFGLINWLKDYRRGNLDI